MAPVVMLDIAGLEPDAVDRDLLRHPAVGGLILFSRNVDTPAQVRDLCRSVREVRPDLLLAVDQEGGRVQRFREGFTRLPPMAALGRLHDREAGRALRAATVIGRLMAEEVVATGVDLSFAPVLDLDRGCSSVIGDRAFHHDPEVVAALAGAFVDGMAQAGMAATGKHFPGHGHVVADSHLELPVDERPLEQILAQDVRPFAALAARLQGIMPAHVVYAQVAPEPAGFSPRWHRLLRQELGFEGLVFSDDLSMEGAAGCGDHVARAEAALAAGCDMVLVCNDRPAAERVVEAVERMTVAPRVLPAALRARPRPAMTPTERVSALALAEGLCNEDG